MLPEVFNSNPHIRSVADGYAADGFVAIAPDVYWRQEAGSYLAYTDEGRAKAQSLRARLDTDRFTRDLGDAIVALLRQPPARRVLLRGLRHAPVRGRSHATHGA